MASAVYESEVAFISGVAENGTVVGNSFATMNTRAHGLPTLSEATKWGSGTPGTGADVTYFFTTASNWTASEKAAWQGGLALWSAVADIKFAEAADATSANFVITRGNDRAAFAQYSGQDPSVVGDNTLGLPTPTGSLISIDTNPLSFGPIGQDLGRAVAIRCQRSCTRSATSSVSVTAARTTAPATRWCSSSAPTTPGCGR